VKTRVKKVETFIRIRRVGMMRRDASSPTMCLASRVT
jgi:hypothetical protein